MPENAIKIDDAHHKREGINPDKVKPVRGRGWFLPFFQNDL